MILRVPSESGEYSRSLVKFTRLRSESPRVVYVHRQMAVRRAGNGEYSPGMDGERGESTEHTPRWLDAISNKMADD